MASSVMASVSLQPSYLTFEKSAAGRSLPSLARSSSFKVEASGGKKITTDKPYGINGGMSLRDGIDSSGRKGKFSSSINNTDDWSPSGDICVGGTTGLAIRAVTHAGLLAGGALLVYNTSALAQ